MLLVVLFLCLAGVLFAQGFQSADHVLFVVNNLWIVVSSVFVFMMHLGFSCLETGLTRTKNTVNILFKNLSIVAIGLLTYAGWGFSLMYPSESWLVSNVFGFAGWGLKIPEGVAGLMGYAGGAYTYSSDFLFQAMFAATAATIVSGAVAGRVKLWSFLLFSLIFVGFIYPVIGSWKWGGGWLDVLGFYDFAGSTIVHMVGGAGALAGACLLGARSGKYVNGQVRPILGHSMPLAAVGTFLLWFGWYGFNGGSVLSADPGLISFVCVTTSIAAAAGVVGSVVASYFFQGGKPDMSMIFNGALAGLVGITAGSDVLSFMSAFWVGLIAGFIVVLSVIFVDRFLKIDDPVGAVSVHLVCGFWGTIAVGLFSAQYSFRTQLIGALSCFVVSFFSAFVIFYVLKLTLGIRVSNEEEEIGLDLGEHQMEAYPSFQIFTSQ